MFSVVSKYQGRCLGCGRKTPRQLSRMVVLNWAKEHSCEYSSQIEIVEIYGGARAKSEPEKLSRQRATSRAHNSGRISGAIIVRTPELIKELAAGARVVYVRTRMPYIPREVHKCWAQCGRWGYAWDHCHQHDLVRGILCGRCNLMFGRMDAGVRPYYSTDLDVQLWEEWLQNCADCSRQSLRPMLEIESTDSSKCQNGHTYTEENTIINTRGSKICRRCYTARVKHPEQSSLLAQA